MHFWDLYKMCDYRDQKQEYNKVCLQAGVLHPVLCRILRFNTEPYNSLHIYIYICPHPPANKRPTR